MLSLPDLLVFCEQRLRDFFAENSHFHRKIPNIFAKIRAYTDAHTDAYTDLISRPKIIYFCCRPGISVHATKIVIFDTFAEKTLKPTIRIDQTNDKILIFLLTRLQVKLQKKSNLVFSKYSLLKILSFVNIRSVSMPKTNLKFSWIFMELNLIKFWPRFQRPHLICTGKY